MLDLAFKYEDQIRIKLFDTWYDEKYKFYYTQVYREVYKQESSTDLNSRTFVSLDKDNNVIGVIGYSINRDSNVAYEFGAINFTDNIYTFGKDMGKVIDEIFTKFNMRKLEFRVIVGNPIETKYDKLIKKYGGRIVGVLKDHHKLIDNNYYDEKIYEIFRDDYISSK